MFISIGLTLAKLVTGKAISDKTAKGIGIGALILAAALALGIGKVIYDRNLIGDYERGVQAGINKDLLEAEREANASRAARDSSFASSQADISEGMEDARTNDPNHGARPIGPVSQGYYDRLREQQNARPR